MLPQENYESEEITTKEKFAICSQKKLLFDLILQVQLVVKFHHCGAAVAQTGETIPVWIEAN